MYVRVVYSFMLGLGLCMNIRVMVLWCMYACKGGVYMGCICMLGLFTMYVRDRPVFCTM